MSRLLAVTPVTTLVLAVGASAAGGVALSDGPIDRSRLTSVEYRSAVHAAQDRLDHTSGYRLTEAYAVVRAGRHLNTSNVGVECPHRYLRIVVVGTFPRITTGGGPGLPHAVTSLQIDATTRSGRPCEVGVGTSPRYDVPAGAADLLPLLR